MSNRSDAAGLPGSLQLPGRAPGSPREEQRMRIRIDREKCVSAGNCVVTAPTVFILDDEEKAALLDPGSVDEDTLRVAAELCPTEAIVLETDDGEQIYP
jgi:ferredoxin